MTTRRVAWRRSDEVETDEHCTLTVRDSGLSLVGTVLGSEDGAFVGMSLPFSESFRLIVEHDAFRLTSGFEIKASEGFALRVLFRPNETLVGFQTRARF